MCVGVKLVLQILFLNLFYKCIIKTISDVLHEKTRIGFLYVYYKKKTRIGFLYVYYKNECKHKLGFLSFICYLLLLFII